MVFSDSSQVTHFSSTKKKQKSKIKDQSVVSSGGIVWHYYVWAHCSMEHVSVWGSDSAVDHRSVAVLEHMPKGGEVIPLALSRYDTLKKKLETCGGVFGDQADHRAFFPWRMAETKIKRGWPSG